MANMSLYASFPFLRSKSSELQQVISASWSDRKKALNNDVNLFCWNRSLDMAIQKYLLEILNGNAKPIRCNVNRTHLHSQLKQVRAHWDSVSKIDGEVFWQDVSMLVYDFLEFSENGSGTLHLRIIDDNACTKFHTDGYPLRLFTTYMGPGTEWLPEDATNRVALGTTNERIVKDKSRIQQLTTGEVGILKGELPNSSQSAKGIVHRSPEIIPTGQKRIILRVDI